MNTTLQGTPQQALAGATTGFFIGFAAVALFGPTAHLIKDSMQLTPLMAAFLVAAPSLSGSLLRIPFAAWVDSTGGRKPFLVLLGLSVLGMGGLTALIAWSYPDRLSSSLYPWLLLLGVLSGCGIATFSVGASQVAYWYPHKRQGSALGVYAGLGNLAPGLFTLLLPLVLSQFGLARSYLVWFGILVVGTGLYYLFGRNAWYFQLRQQGLPAVKAHELARTAGQEIFPSSSRAASLFLSARVWKSWALVGIYFTTFGGFVALTAWLPTYWNSYLNTGVLLAGGMTALYSISASLFRVFGGTLADRFGGETTTLLALMVTGTGALLLVFSGNLWTSLTAQMLMAAGMGVSNAAVFKLVSQSVPQAVGGASGWVGGLGAFGGFAIPPLLGAVVRSQGHSGYASGFWVFVLLVLFALFLTFLLRQTLPGKLGAPKGSALQR
jgi:MFS transporter, NNP family, nitrate/nitrite transporter